MIKKNVATNNNKNFLNRIIHKLVQYKIIFARTSNYVNKAITYTVITAIMLHNGFLIFFISFVITII